MSLILVCDLDNTLVAWSGEPDKHIADKGFQFGPYEGNRYLTVNSTLIGILKEAFKVKKYAICLTNNNFAIPNILASVKKVEELLGQRFDFLIDRFHESRRTRIDNEQIFLKDIGTINRILKETVTPSDVWMLDDLETAMQHEGANCIRVLTQENDKPYSTGFVYNPDMTDYTPLLQEVYRRLPAGGYRRKSVRKIRRTRRTRKLYFFSRASNRS